MSSTLIVFFQGDGEKKKTFKLTYSEKHTFHKMKRTAKISY